MLNDALHAVQENPPSGVKLAGGDLENGEEKETTIWGFPKIRGTILGGPLNKDYSIGVYIGGPPILRNYHLGFRIEGYVVGFRG